jgi:hypothetical protein
LFLWVGCGFVDVGGDEANDAAVDLSDSSEAGWIIVGSTQ